MRLQQCRFQYHAFVGCNANDWAQKCHEETVSFFVRLIKEACISASRTDLANTYSKIDIRELPPSANVRDFRHMGIHMELDISIMQSTEGSPSRRL